jgi:hypothetical protein
MEYYNGEPLRLPGGSAEEVAQGADVGTLKSSEEV